MAYKAVHTGPKSQFGGCHEGFLRVLYLNVSTCLGQVFRQAGQASCSPPLDLLLHADAHADTSTQRDGDGSRLHVRAVCAAPVEHFAKTKAQKLAQAGRQV